jgi:hypothetical protein
MNTYHNFRHPPKSHDEWLQLVQQQEALHNIELQKWQKVLQAAVQLLRQVTSSLLLTKFQPLFIVLRCGYIYKARKVG